MELRQMSDLARQMTEDLRWADSAPEVQCPEHYGKCVVIRNKRVLGSGTDRMALVQRVAEQEQVPWQQLAVVIVHGPDFLEIPH